MWKKWLMDICIIQKLKITEVHVIFLKRRGNCKSIVNFIGVMHYSKFEIRKACDIQKLNNECLCSISKVRNVFEIIRNWGRFI